jgi:EAL domain-containing protein (putative c-di-GMP-specific phosphodiesterase class I)
VRNIVNEPVDEIIVDSIAQISTLLDLETVAEYVENDAILMVIKKIGIDYAQGYGIEKPSPLETLH